MLGPDVIPAPIDAPEADGGEARQLPALIPQPHGGALLTGGVPGNRGGGSVSRKVTQQARQALAKLVADVTEQLETDERIGIRTKLEAIRELGRIAVTEPPDKPPLRVFVLSGTEADALRELGQVPEPEPVAIEAPAQDVEPAA